MLGAEADGDSGGSAEQGKDGEGDLNGGKGDEADEEEEGVVCEFLDDRAGGGVEVEALAEADADSAAPTVTGSAERKMAARDFENGKVLPREKIALVSPPFSK